MKKPNPNAFIPLDEEEKQLMLAEEKNLLKPISNEEFLRLKNKLIRAAENTSIARETRKMISIKIMESDLALLKLEAQRKGLRYQSLINSILHQHVREGAG